MSIWDNSALVVIDLAAFAKHISKDALPVGWEALETNNRRLINTFRSQGRRVIVATVEPKFLPAGLARRFGRLLIQDLLDDAAFGVEKLVKWGPSAVKRSDFGLTESLRADGISRVYLTGISMSNGVLATARDLAADGFDVTVVTDACADKSLSAYEKAVKSSIPAIGYLTTVEELLGD